MHSNAHMAANRLNIAIIGSGISGLSAAWLLSKRHNVTVFEADGRIGGHSNTVDAGTTPVDTGFIVYNEATYPNLTALFAHLDVPTKETNMSFAVSLDDGRLEYAGTGLSGLFAQRRNIIRPRFWSMLRDLLRFYREAPGDIINLGNMSLADYIDFRGYGAAFRDDHLYPMAAAIWSTNASEMGKYPASAFIRFCENHGLLKIADRPIWRTVDGGSRVYVRRLTESFADRIVTGFPVRNIHRLAKAVVIEGKNGVHLNFDHVVIAAHADQALAMLAEPSEDERTLLGAFKYSQNKAVLHSDASLMPRRKAVWASWNYAAQNDAASQDLSVTYWMNRLQGIPNKTPLFLTLNPSTAPDDALVIHRETYTHPLFDAGAMQAQQRLWDLQGGRSTWFCGAYFGAGFHEDGLQAGLAVGEALGGVRRPWEIEGESARIVIDSSMARSNLTRVAS